MTIEIRTCTTDEEFADAFMGIGQYFGATPDSAWIARFRPNLPLERMLAAFHGEGIVGAAGSYPFELSVPGGTVPCAGVTLVGVYPTHRRRGILRGLMRAQLDDVHGRGEPLAALWASEEPIYGRFGYGLASWAGEINVPHQYTGFAHPVDRRATLRLVDGDEAASLLPPVWDELVAVRPGVFRRTETWWRSRILDDPPALREGAGPKRIVVCELDGAVRGYAIYDHRPAFEAGSAVTTLHVREAIAADPQATAELWRYLLEIDWTATVNAGLLPPDHPLFLLAASPRRYRYRRGDGLWVRLVDVEAALGARSYGSHEPLVLELEDAFCPWNEGRWRLNAGVAERTDAAPDLRLDAEALGSAYLGGISFAELGSAQRVAELRPGALARADALFRAPLHPWCPEIF